MRIALIAPFGLRAKGTARARALPLGQALVRGHEVTLFVPPYDSPEDSGARWTDGGVQIVNIRLPSDRALGPAGHFRLAWRLLRSIRAWQPDVVHAFKPKGPSGLVAAGVQGTRLVVDSDDWEGPGGWNDDPRAGYSTLQRCFFAWQERYGLSHADAWTVASSCLRDRAVAFGAAAERVFLLPNGSAGLHLKTDAVAQAQDASPRSVVLYSRFAGVRVDAAAGIWGRVVAALPDARLTVIGRGLAGEEGMLAQRAPGVEAKGWMEPECLPAALAPALLAIIPWADTPANRARNSAKVLELMSAGLPLVAYAVGELPATVGETGVLVTPGDEVAFAHAVIDLLSDPERARRLGRAARERVAAYYSWDHLADTALTAYAAAGCCPHKTGFTDS